MIREIANVDSTEIRADICVIGGGAAGLTLASELNGSDLRVVLLESGGRRVDRRTQELYQSELRGLPHGGVHGYRFRVFGGATTRWAGQALPLDDIDFAERDWVPDSGWPVTRSELEPYYVRAAALMGIDAFSLDPMERWPAVLPPPPAYNTDLLEPLFSQFTSQPNFADMLSHALERSRNVQVLLRANVTELVPDQTGSEIQAVLGRSFDGRAITVRADVYVVCAGGIETARILLSSDRYTEGGLGNSHDLVGRYFQDHPGLTVGKVAARDSGKFSELFRARRGAGIKYQPRFKLAGEVQAGEGLLNSGGAVLFHMSQSASIAAGALLYKSIRHPELRSEAAPALRTALRAPMPLIRAATRHFVMRQPALDPQAEPELAVGCEQAPNPDSRVMLSTERDELGMPRTVLDWHLTEAEIRAWRRTAELVALELERLDLARVDLGSFDVPEDPERLGGIVVDNGHHMGTTRMSDSAANGVVDPNCRVHGLDNLYVGSASVFPTSGVSNPTFTIIALTIRIADALKSRFGESRCRDA